MSSLKEFLYAYSHTGHVRLVTSTLNARWQPPVPLAGLTPAALARVGRRADGRLVVAPRADVRKRPVARGGIGRLDMAHDLSRRHDIER
ncbi:hypothetical protein ACWDA3_27875 [Nonomuraea rubra]